MVQAAGQASLIGRTLGKYAVRALIGRGAMGAVYLARDRTLGRWVALKVLLGSPARNPEQVRSFQREAQAAAPLQHSNIVRIYEAGILEGVPFIAMEYIEGEPLDRFLRRKGPRLRWQNALHIAHEVAKALDRAARAGIVHRDVKPANILLDRHGRVRLTDFGIARVHEEGGAAESRGFFGTPEYMSPEQCTEQGEVSPASDLFSLGVTLYQMLCGRMPFAGHTTEALVNSITTGEPARLNRLVPELPDDVARLTAHLLEKNPGARPASAREVCQRIARLQAENGGRSAMPAALEAYIRESAEPRKVRAETPTPAPNGQDTGTTEERRRALTPVARVCAAALLAIAGFGAGYWHMVRPMRLPEPAPALQSAVFYEDERTGVHYLELPGRDWIVAGLHWAGGTGTVVAEVRGRAGACAEGARGLFIANPKAKTVRSLCAPSGPALQPDFWKNHVPQGALGPLPPTPPQSPLHNAIVHAVYRSGDSKDARLVGLAQQVDEGAPRRKALFEMDARAWAPAAFEMGTRYGGGAVLPRPDGRGACLLLHTPDGQSNCLAEWEVGQRSPNLITSGDAPIVSGSVQYLDQGERIAFLRQKTGRERALWLLERQAGAWRSVPVAFGPFGGCPAFQPGGAVAALSLRQNTGVESVLVAVPEGKRLRELGPGEVAMESWHPSGGYLVLYTNAPHPVQSRLWAVETAAPWRRVPLVEPHAGQCTAAAVSRDGRWAVFANDVGHRTELVFVELDPFLFNLKTAQRR